MFRVVNTRALILTLSTALVCAACQSPTDPDDTIGVDDFVDGSISPDPVNAIESPDGKTYRVPRNNEPDEIRLYDWKATFSASVRLNDTANDKDLDLAFPVKIASIGVTVQQASGGIVTPPTGGDTVHSEYVVRDSSGSRFSGANTANNCNIDVWYDLPSLRKEALITVSIGLVDDDGRAFTKTIDVKVNP
jgi:hypothetical protein